MGVFGIFRLKGFDPDVFEKELTQLTKQISNSQQQIYGLKGKSKQWVFSLCKVLISMYILIFVYIYQKIPRSPIARNKMVNFLRSQTNDQFMILVGFPVVGYLLVYLINYVFKLSISRREKYLKIMKKKHSQKIEELKKITNFNTTNELLNKYGTEDERKKSKSESEAKTAEAQLNAQPQQQVNSQAKSPSAQQQQIIQRLQSLQANPPVQAPRTFQDRVLDFIVGSDNNEATENRFALICKQCLTHNGLAPPGCSNPFLVSYICPNCGFLNGEIDDVDSDVNPIETEELKANEHTSMRVDPALNRQLIDTVIDQPGPPLVEPVDSTTRIGPDATDSTSINKLANAPPL